MLVPFLDDLDQQQLPGDVYPFNQIPTRLTTWRTGCSLAALGVKGSSMPAKIITYSSPAPAPATTLAKVFGDKASEVKVTVRASKDVPKFLAKLAEARQKSRHSTLRFK